MTGLMRAGVVMQAQSRLVSPVTRRILALERTSER